MIARDSDGNVRLETMARAAADALIGAPVDWEGFSAETRRVFLAVALAVHRADGIELVGEARDAAQRNGGAASPLISAN